MINAKFNVSIKESSPMDTLILVRPPEFDVIPFIN